MTSELCHKFIVAVETKDLSALNPYPEKKQNSVAHAVKACGDLEKESHVL
jgi:hypothetical protein